MLIVVTIASLTLAVVMSVVAWRASRSERLRSEARVEALARAIHAPTVDLDLRAAQPAVAAASHGLFDVTSEPPAAASRAGLALAVGAFVVASVAAMAVVFGGPSTSARVAEKPAMSAARGTGESPAVSGEPVPLELIGLSHDRDGDQLTVRGTVRNPATGTVMNQLSAVVSLIDGDGNFVASSRALVAAPSLIPGGETPFAVVIPNAKDVARFRVGFRSGDRPVAHVDKRAKS